MLNQPTVLNSHNPSRVYIRLRKHGKRFLLLKYKQSTKAASQKERGHSFDDGIPMGLLAPVYLENSVSRLVAKTKLQSLIVDHILTWTANLLDAKKSLAKKMDLLKRSLFLPRGILKNFYFKVILPAVKYGLVLWGSCCNSF